MSVSTTVDPGKHYLMQSIIHGRVYYKRISNCTAMQTTLTRKILLPFFSRKYPVVATKARAQSRAGF